MNRDYEAGRYVWLQVTLSLFNDTLYLSRALKIRPVANSAWNPQELQLPMRPLIMGEVVGIALGSITLFSTLIDLVDFFQEARFFSEDVEIVFTKITVMKERLDQWTRMISVDSLGQETAKALDTRLPQENDIQGCLYRMRTILEHTVRTCYRYRRRQKPTTHAKQALARLRQRYAPSHPPSQAAEALPSELSQPRTHKPVPLRLKFLWVLADKKKLQKLMSDLDFLLNNLEKVTENLRKDIISNYNPHGHGR